MIVRFGTSHADGCRVWVDDAREGRLRSRRLVETPDNTMVELAVISKTGRELIERVESLYLVEDKGEPEPEPEENRITVSEDGKRVSGGGFTCQSQMLLISVMAWLKKAVEEKCDTTTPPTVKVSGAKVRVIRADGRIEFEGGAYVAADDVRRMVKVAGYQWPTSA